MECAEMDTAVLTGMLREGITMKVTSEQRCEGGDRKKPRRYVHRKCSRERG